MAKTIEFNGWGLLWVLWVLAVAYFLFGAVFKADYKDEQAKILAGIESTHTAAASKFVALWQQTHKYPDSDDVAALRVKAEQIKGDPSQAEAAGKALKDQVASDILPTLSILILIAIVVVGLALWR